MQVIGDIFGLWDSLANMARELGIEYQTVAKWSQRGRIPPESWPAVIEAAKRRKIIVTPALLAKLNKPRGTANVVREARAQG